jgi:hypothetical protein
VVGALAELADALEDAGVTWLLAGGASRALRGAPDPPRDLDVEIAPRHVGRAERALGARLAPSEGRIRSRRAIVAVRGVWVDASADVEVVAPSELPSDFALQLRAARVTSVRGRTIRHAPDEELLMRFAAAGERRRLAKLGERLIGWAALSPDYVLARSARAVAAR